MERTESRARAARCQPEVDPVSWTKNGPFLDGEAGGSDRRPEGRHPFRTCTGARVASLRCPILAQYDLYKDTQGNVFVKGNGGVGEAIPTGLKINRL